ncbi:hypothetical protein [Collimonas sp. PA-H2]|uniref:hypothetical protein n=1 Tax=Collimonas sp. PA-H2 TaxID=1881062 RepID=UPI000BF36921|nr:hypothetical protein [Collimonas sp. PA-H2]
MPATHVNYHFTMEQDFYKDRLHARHGLQVLIPAPEDRDVGARGDFLNAMACPGHAWAGRNAWLL